MNDTFEIQDAECIAESVDGTQLLVEAPIFDEPEWIGRNVIMDNSEVQREEDSGTLIIKKWFARHRKWL